VLIDETGRMDEEIEYLQVKKPKIMEGIQPQKGWIEAIGGSMFSGKTEELIRRLKRANIAKQKVEIFKPRIDNRYHETKIVSHDNNEIFSVVVESASDILLLAPKDLEVVGIDEAQFFTEGLPEVCEILAGRKIRVIVAGLDLDYLGKPFGPMPALFAIAEFVTKVHAICPECGYLASHSHRITEGDELFLVGGKDEYLPLCRLHFYEKNPHLVKK